MENKVQLSPPWQTYVNELKAMFEYDHEVQIKYDDAEKQVYIFVAKAAKAAALEKILCSKAVFGNVTLTVNVVPPNEDEQPRDVLEDFEDALRDNPLVRSIFSNDTPFGKYRYVGFHREVVQFYNDQMDDPNGNKSMLLQEIARDIFKPSLIVNYYTEDH